MDPIITLFRQYLQNSQEAAKACLANPEKTVLLLNENMKLSMRIYEQYESRFFVISKLPFEENVGIEGESPSTVLVVV